MTKKKTTKKKDKKEEEKQRDSAGRPTKYCEEIVKKLIECLEKDYTISEACDQAGISRPTYYKWLEEIPVFSYKMDKAQGSLFAKAKDNVAGAVRAGDIDRSEWLLSRRQRDRYATKTENAIGAVEPLTPEEDAEVEEALKNAGL
jgi:hypothetical protein